MANMKLLKSNRTVQLFGKVINSKNINFARYLSTNPRQSQHLWQSRESFKSSDLKIIRCAPTELAYKPDPNKVDFGHCFTDHMFRCDWDNEEGWSVPNITKVHEFKLHPGSKCLHYALQVR